MVDNAQPEEPARALIIAAHPDDPEFGAGGAACLWVSQGMEVYYLLCTSGDKGSSDPTMSRSRLVEMREGEQRAAVKAAGGTDVTFLRFPDGELYPTLEFRRAVTREIRRLRPQIVATHDPGVIYTDSGINHPDHRAVGTATIDSVYPTARDRLNFPDQEQDGLLAHKVSEVYLWGNQNPNVWLDITSVIDKKIEALRCHKSQISNPEELEKRMRERAKTVGETQGMEYAEAYFRVNMGR